MSSTGIYCVVFAVGLVFLSQCSTGQALECYNCGWTSSKCTTSLNCAAPNDACMTVTRTDGAKQYSCRVYDKCTIAIVGPEIGITNFQLRCCQNNLCNSSIVPCPSTVLLLGLVAALLKMMS